MVENFRYFDDYPEDFEQRLAWLDRKYDDPAFVEFVNDILIINESSDGQRVYSPNEILSMGMRHLESVMEGAQLMKGSSSQVLAQGLAEATDNFNSAGSFTLKGKMAFHLADEIYFLVNKLNLDSKVVMEYMETFVAGALALSFDKFYETYQTDITLTEQGLLPETYELNVQFRPIPKNVFVPGRGVEPPCP